MIYQQMPHNFIRFEDCLINVSHIVEVFDDSVTPNNVIIILSSGGSINVPGTAKKFAELCGLDHVDYKPSVKARP